MGPVSATATTSAGAAVDNSQFPCDPSQGHASGNANGSPSYCDAQVGELVDVALRDLHPTQPSLGYDEVYYKLGRYTLGKDTINKRFDDWCEANGQQEVVAAQADATLADPSSFTCAIPLGSETQDSVDAMKTAVVGPGGQLYLTDGHHTFTSFWETPDGGPNLHVRVRITGNLSNLDPAAFWQAMQAESWTWLRDADDEPIAPQQLPAHLGLSEFGNDRCRGVLYFARDIGYTQDVTNATFQEFYWGRWLRAQSLDADLNLDKFDLNDLPSYLELVANISHAIVDLDDNAEVSDGRTALEMGKLPAFDSSEFTKLSKPYSDPNPGKLAYALAYKATL